MKRNLGTSVLLAAGAINLRGTVFLDPFSLAPVLGLIRTALSSSASASTLILSGWP
jgi:hypothetical protein